MEIRFLASHDGTQIGYLVIGQGAPFVRVAQWGNSVQAWASHGLPAEFQGWARGRRFITADPRGVGASQRDVEEISLDALVGDLAALVDHQGIGTFDLHGAFDGSVVAMAYAAAHPDRVSHLVVGAPFAWGRDVASEDASASLASLARTNWHLATRVFAGISVDREPSDVQLALARNLRSSLSPDTAARYVELFSNVDIRHCLPRISCPTLVLQRRVDRLVPVQAGRRVASLIPGARLLSSEIGRSVSINPFDSSVVEFIDSRRPPVVEAEKPHGTAVILFADIVDSTALTERLGDNVFRDRARSLDECLRFEIRHMGGMPIKGRTLGDGVLALCPSAQSAISAAIRCVSAAEALGLALHIGIHAGDVIREGEDVYGGAVNLAARVTALSGPNEILVSTTVRDLARTSTDVVFEDRGEHAMKGIGDPVRVFVVNPRIV